MRKKISKKVTWRQKFGDVVVPEYVVVVEAKVRKFHWWKVNSLLKIRISNNAEGSCYIFTGGCRWDLESYQK